MKLPSVILSVSLLTIISSSAAVVTWSSSLYVNTGNAKATMGENQFDQSGTQIFAVNLNGPAMTMTQSIDPDITFTASSLGLDTSALSQAYGGYFANPAGAGNDDIIRTGDYRGGGVRTITLNNLVVGHTYRFQALVADGRGNQTGRTVSFDGIDQGTYANGTSGSSWGDSLLVTGTFTADATSQPFTLQNFTPTGGNAGSQFNAGLLHVTAVPEPSGIALFGLATLGMFSRRRR